MLNGIDLYFFAGDSQNESCCGLLVGDIRLCLHLNNQQQLPLKI